jgi:predicted DNA binding CopG/RHH family protein
MDYLDKEEKELIESIENDEWSSVGKEELGIFLKAAKASATKSKRINIRLTEKDYHDIQAKAMEEGIPYQTLISSIIHKYNKGKLKSDPS